MADTGHTAGQFEGHTPGPWRGNISGTFSTVSDHAENDETLCWIDLEPGAVVWTNPADYTLAIAAPSLLARAEAAEERVRVLEALLAKVADEDSYDRCNWIDEVEAALAATGVQR